MSGGALLVLLLVGLPLPRPDGWDELERRLQDRVLSETARREIRDQLPTDDLPELLKRLPQWSVGAQLATRQALAESLHHRRGLLTCSLEGSALAREILVAQRLARLDETLPWSDGVAARRQRADLIRPRGLRLSFRTSASRVLDLPELLVLLEETGSLAAPLVIHPACHLEGRSLVGDGLMRSAEWWLEDQLDAAGCVAVRLLQATWIVPRKKLPEAEEPGDLEEWQRAAWMRRLEARWLDDALRELSLSSEPRRSWRALLLCERLGLPCPGDGAASQILAAAVRGRSAQGLPQRPPPAAAGPEARRWWARACVGGGGGLPADGAVREFVLARRRGRPGVGSTGAEPSVPAGRLGQRWQEGARPLVEVARTLSGPQAQEWARFLAQAADSATLLALLEELCGDLEDDARAAKASPALSLLRWVIAARAEDDSLLAGRARSAVRERAREASGGAAERLSREAERFWHLGAASLPPERWLDLDEWSWLPRD